MDNVRDRALQFVLMAAKAGATGTKMNKPRKEARIMGAKESYRTHFQSELNDGLSYLSNAAFKGQDFVVELLLEYFGVDPNDAALDRFRKTALHYAAEAGNLSIARALINEHLAHIDALDVSGSTPLHLAIYRDRTQVAQQLIQSDASLEISGVYGRAIHTATFHNRHAIVAAIHQRSPKEVDCSICGFCSPLVCAIYCESAECEIFLMKVCVLNNHLMSKVISYKKYEEEACGVVASLLAKGVNGNLCEDALYEDIPIIAAAKKKWSRLIKILLRYTERIEGIDWTEAGLISYVQSPEFQALDTAKTQTRVNNLKARIIVELTAGNVLVASLICKSLKNDMVDEEWKNYDCLCHCFGWSAINGEKLPVDVDRVYFWSRSLWKNEFYDKAVMALRGCLALDPRSEKIRQSYETHQAALRAMSATSSGSS